MTRHEDGGILPLAGLSLEEAEQRWERAWARTGAEELWARAQTNQELIIASGEIWSRIDADPDGATLGVAFIAKHFLVKAEQHPMSRPRSGRRRPAPANLWPAPPLVWPGAESATIRLLNGPGDVVNLRQELAVGQLWVRLDEVDIQGDAVAFNRIRSIVQRLRRDMGRPFGTPGRPADARLDELRKWLRSQPTETTYEAKVSEAHRQGLWLDREWRGRANKAALRERIRRLSA